MFVNRRLTGGASRRSRKAAQGRQRSFCGNRGRGRWNERSQSSKNWYVSCLKFFRRHFKKEFLSHTHLSFSALPLGVEYRMCADGAQRKNNERRDMALANLAMPDGQWGTDEEKKRS